MDWFFSSLTFLCFTYSTYAILLVEIEISLPEELSPASSRWKQSGLLASCILLRKKLKITFLCEQFKVVILLLQVQKGQELKDIIRILYAIVSKAKNLLGLGLSFILVFRNEYVGTAELTPASFSRLKKKTHHLFCAVALGNQGQFGDLTERFRLLVSMSG